MLSLFSNPCIGLNNNSNCLKQKKKYSISLLYYFLEKEREDSVIIDLEYIVWMQAARLSG